MLVMSLTEWGNIPKRDKKMDAKKGPIVKFRTRLGERTEPVDITTGRSATEVAIDSFQWSATRIAEIQIRLRILGASDFHLMLMTDPREYMHIRDVHSTLPFGLSHMDAFCSIAKRVRTLYPAKFTLEALEADTPVFTFSSFSSEVKEKGGKPWE